MPLENVQVLIWMNFLVAEQTILEEEETITKTDFAYV